MTATAEAALPSAWTLCRLLPQQAAYLRSRAWMNVVVAGRRSFKSEAAKRRVVMAAMRHDSPGARFFACAPTQQQAKEIFWTDQSNLRRLVPDWMVSDIRHSDPQTITLANGSRIIVAGLDRPQRIEGGFWDGGVITEYGNCKSDVFAEHISPMLARGGWIDFEGVPEGRSEPYYPLVCNVRDGKIPGARLFEWSSEDALPLYLGVEGAEQFLARERAHMSPRQYQQEWLGWFVSMEGQAYYAFDPAKNVRADVRYDPELPLILCFDFNRVPGVCLFVQEHPRDRYRGLKSNPFFETVTAVIGEVFIRQDSNTRKVAQEILDRWQRVHQYELLLYGDSTGGAGGSAKVDGSDWDILRDMLQPVWGRHYRNCVPSENPPVRRRVNAVNSRLVAADGSVGTVINRDTAPNFIRDLEGVEADAAGEIVKEQGGPLTHISDAFGYYIAERFPVRTPQPGESQIRTGQARRRMAGHEIIPGGGV